VPRAESGAHAWPRPGDLALTRRCCVTPTFWRGLLPSIPAAIDIRHTSHEQFRGVFDLVLRTEWTIERVGLVLQAMLDCFVLRYRAVCGPQRRRAGEGVSAFADAIVAFILGGGGLRAERFYWEGKRCTQRLPPGLARVN